MRRNTHVRTLVAPRRDRPTGRYCAECGEPVAPRIRPGEAKPRLVCQECAGLR